MIVMDTVKAVTTVVKKAVRIVVKKAVKIFIQAVGL